MKCGILFVASAFCLLACTPERPSSFIPQDRFVKKQVDGKAIDLLAGPWACVQDKQTGLHWEVKSSNENAHFANSTYSWKIAERGSDNGGKCGVDKPGFAEIEYQSCDAQDLIDHLNQIRLCGFSDWRLPTASELRSLMFKNPNSGKRVLPVNLLPNIPRSPFWTSEYKEQEDGLTAQTIHMGNGDELWAKTESAANVIAVQGERK